jgi:hypothetical protein
MPAPKQNNYWQFRNKHGKPKKYTPEELWKEAEEYFQWVEDHPLWEMKLFAYQGIISKDKVPKMRAMTITAFTLFADICHNTWLSYKQNEDYVQVITRIENHIKSQKFEGAAAELLNPNIIARDLGLKDKADITSNDQTIAPQIYIPTNGRD